MQTMSQGDRRPTPRDLCRAQRKVVGSGGWHTAPLTSGTGRGSKHKLFSQLGESVRSCDDSGWKTWFSRYPLVRSRSWPGDGFPSEANRDTKRTSNLLPYVECYTGVRRQPKGSSPMKASDVISK